MKKDFNNNYKITNFNNLGIDINYIDKTLHSIWFLQSPIDVEHKYYIIMDYLQNVDINIDKGYYYKEFIKITIIYKDLQCFKSSYSVMNKNKEDEKILNYIYNLSPGSLVLQEIIKIVDLSLEIIGNTYTHLLEKINEFYDNTKIIETVILDKRKPIYFYIQKCNAGFYEIFELKKSGKIIEHPFIKTEEIANISPDINYVIIDTEIPYSSLGTILPFAISGGEQD